MQLYPHSTQALQGGGWSTPRPGLFIFGKEIRYLFYRRLGGRQGPKNLALIGLQTLNHPANSESQYRLIYLGRIRRFNKHEMYDCAA